MKWQRRGKNNLIRALTRRAVEQSLTGRLNH